MRIWKRLFSLLLIVLSLAGCAQFHPLQTPGTVIVRTEGYDSNELGRDRLAGSLAARVLPYGLLARQSYEPQAYLDKQAVKQTYGCGALISGVNGIPPCTDAVAAENGERGMSILKGWRYVAGCDYASGDKGADAANRRDGCPAIAWSGAEGLGVQLWIHEDGPVCSEAAIVFRGTVSGDHGDLESDLHWIRRLVPGHKDQYDQVSQNIDKYLDPLRHVPCYREHVTQIVAIGHSLGGGLAQLAAYSDSRIKRVYAFDPSMVIGRDTVDAKVLDHDKQGVRMEYIYEHGEVLAYPRYLIRQFEPPTTCNPRIVTERFKLLHGNVFDQHSLSDFNHGLLLISRGEKPEAKPFVMEDIPPCKDQHLGENVASK